MHQDSSASILADDPCDRSSLTVAQAQHLAARPGWLRLDSLTSLPSDVAAALARHEGGLALGMLTSLSEESEDVLAGHRGELQIPFLEELRTRSLAAKLAGQPSWGGRALLYVSEAAAQGLVTRAGPLDIDLSGLREVSQQASDLLEKHGAAHPVILPPRHDDGSGRSTRIIGGGSPLWRPGLVLMAWLGRFVIGIYAFLFVPIELHGHAETRYTLGSQFWPMCRALWPYILVSGVFVALGTALAGSSRRHGSHE